MSSSEYRHSISNGALEDLLTLIDDYHSFNPPEVPVLAYPSSLEFCKQVSKGLPCVYGDPPGPHHVTSPKAQSSAYEWTRESLSEHVKQAIEVAVTPNGRADALCRVGEDDAEIFLQPAAVLMTLADLLDRLCSREGSDDPCSRPVYYLQSQNSNLTSTPLTPLMKHLSKSITFASDVLGQPEAINIWIGDERSVTSTHRDPYENLYLVLKGSKTFTLWAPVDEVTLDVQMVRTGRYRYDEASGFSIDIDEGEKDEPPQKIPWVPIDPDIDREVLEENHPLYQHARPRKVVVSEGQMLYLPAGWYHHVSQRCGEYPNGSRAPCIAVNYWYDQDYDGEKYVMRQLVDRLVRRAQTSIYDIRTKLKFG